VALALRLCVEAARINLEDDTPGQTLIDSRGMTEC
jgi:hypothetical protein